MLRVRSNIIRYHIANIENIRKHTAVCSASPYRLLQRQGCPRLVPARALRNPVARWNIRRRVPGSLRVSRPLRNPVARWNIRRRAPRDFLTDIDAILASCLSNTKFTHQACLTTFSALSSQVEAARTESKANMSMCRALCFPRK